MAKLLLLGPAREAAGIRHDSIDASCVGELLQLAGDRYGEAFQRVLAVSQIWLNGEWTELTALVGPHDEVAVLPPVAGG